MEFALSDETMTNFILALAFTVASLLISLYKEGSSVVIVLLDVVLVAALGFWTWQSTLLVIGVFSGEDSTGWAVPYQVILFCIAAFPLGMLRRWGWFPFRALVRVHPFWCVFIGLNCLLVMTMWLGSVSFGCANPIESGLASAGVCVLLLLMSLLLRDDRITRQWTSYSSSWKAPVGLSRYDAMIARFTGFIPVAYGDDADAAAMEEGVSRWFEAERARLSPQLPGGADGALGRFVLSLRFRALLSAGGFELKRALVRDEAFERLEELSEEIFDLAKQTLFKGDRVIKGVEVTDALVEEVRRLKVLVRDFNAREAKKLVSETILDLDLACCPGTGILSYRIGEVLYALPEGEQERLCRLCAESQEKYREEIKALNKREDEERTRKMLEGQGEVE